MKTLRSFFDSDLVQQLSCTSNWYQLMMDFKLWFDNLEDVNKSEWNFHEAWDAYITHLRKEW